MGSDLQPDKITEGLILAASTCIPCTVCDVEEMVMPLDNHPLDEYFISNYICDQCEDAGRVHPARTN